MTSTQRRGAKRHDTQDQRTPPFLFVGHALALDFVNTEQVVRGKLVDVLAQANAVARWVADAQQHYPEHTLLQRIHGAVPTDHAPVAALKQLRQCLRDLFEAYADGRLPDSQTIATINTTLAQGHHVLEVTPLGTICAEYAVPYDPTSALAFVLALSALEVIRDGAQARVHRCSNPRCVLLFYDATKSGTRRYCSLACMDRARSSRRYQSAKQATKSQPNHAG